METAPQIRAAASSLRALLDGLIDYAGLFPPAALSMQQAVANYASYLESDHRWALGRFIVPAARLEEFAQEQDALINPESGPVTFWKSLGFIAGLPVSPARTAEGISAHLPWRLSVIVGTELETDVEAIWKFNTKNSRRALIDVVEIKASTIDDVRRIRPLIREEVLAYFEIPADSRTELLHMIHSVGSRAKIRTGGLVETAFPAAEQIAQFIFRCAEAKVAFKATAGLHHPLRCVKPLTYAVDAPKGEMHGFLNVFMAACAYGGLKEDVDRNYREQLRAVLLAILLNESPANFDFQDEKVTMRGKLTENPNYELSVSTEVIRHARANFAIAFGSCSFEEPIEDLRSFHLL